MVIEHSGILGVVQDVEGDTEKREEALTHPRLDVRLDPHPPPIFVDDLGHPVLEPF